jgi:hypothetical protein
LDGTVQDIWVTTESTPPEAIAQDRDTRFALFILTRKERAAELRLYAE